MEQDSPAPAIPKSFASGSSSAFRWRTLRRLLALLGVTIVGTGSWLAAQGQLGVTFPGGPQPSFGRLSISPPNIVFNTPTTVIFAIRIDTPTLNPTAVELQRVAADGSLVAVMGRMGDDGKNGDLKPGDKLFTYQATFIEPKVTRAYFRVAAAFRGNKQDAISDAAVVDVWNQLSLPDTGMHLAYPPTWMLDVETKEATGENVLFDRIAPANGAAAEDVSGLCKVSIAQFDKPATQSLLDFLIERDSQFKVGSSPVMVNSIPGIRHVAVELSTTDAFILSVGETRVVSIQLVSGDDVRNQCRTEFERIVATIGPD